MSGKYPQVSLNTTLITVLLLFVPIVCGVDVIIPSDKSKLDSWYNQVISSSGKSTLDQPLSLAEAHPTVIHVRPNAAGAGSYKTINEAIKSIPANNKNRVVVKIAPGTYTEKIRLVGNKPFVTFYGENPDNMPVLVFHGTALEYGTVDSATLIVDADYFIGVNLKIVNSAPRPDGKRKGAQAAALRIAGNKAVFYNCRLYGFQDTLCDDKGKHLFKDCYIQGTYDFIFGGAKSLYLLDVIPGDATAVIAAHARNSGQHDLGYSFVHCKVTGTGKIASLGRAWKAYARVVYAYSDMSDAVNPQGWSIDNHAEYAKTVYFGEFQNKGPGSNLATRAPFTKKLTIAEAKPFISLDFVEATKWLLPPTPAYIK